MPIRTEPQMSGKHGERYGLITFGPPYGEDNVIMHDDDYPFIMEDEDGVMTLFSTQRQEDESNEQITEDLEGRQWRAELIRILLYARDQGFSYLIIDRDCDETLPASE